MSAGRARSASLYIRICFLTLLLTFAALPTSATGDEPGQGTAFTCLAKDAALKMLTRGDNGSPGLINHMTEALFTCGVADSDLFMALGTILYGRGNSAGALRCWRAAWRLSPLSVGIGNNVAAALIDLARPSHAIEVLRSLEHRLFLAHRNGVAEESWKTDINMASAYAEIDDLPASARRLERALAHPALTSSHPQRPVAAANLVYTRRRLCEWGEFERDQEVVAKLIREQSAGSFDFLLPSPLPVDPFMALTFLYPACRHDYSIHTVGLGEVGPEEVLAATRKYAQGWAVPETLTMHFGINSGFRSLGGWSSGGRQEGGAGHAKVVLGYVCSEFGRRHSVMLLMRAVFARHDREALHVVCFATRPLPRSARRRMGGVEAGVNGRLEQVVPDGCADTLELGEGGDENQARVINAQRTHVVVDLNGWTAGHAMGALAYRPAPLIINYMGFAGSTGAKFVDMAAFDPVVAPPDYSAHFSEGLLLLPHSYFVTDFLRTDFSAVWAPRKMASYGEETGMESDEDELVAQGLEPGAVRICNHDQAYKRDPRRFASWVRIVRPQSEEDAAGERAAARNVTDGSRMPAQIADSEKLERQLWLLEQDSRVDAALAAAVPAAVRPALLFAPKVSVRAHIRRIRACHLAVDTASVGAHTTAANYLWARVPVMTLPGQHVMSRVAASLLIALARNHASGGACAMETIVRSEADYVAVGRALARSAAEQSRRGAAAGDDSTQKQRRRAARNIYTRIRECLRAATEPLEAMLASAPGRGHAEVSKEAMLGHLSQATPAPAVFDTERWVRDWERALFISLELSLSSFSPRTPDARDQGEQQSTRARGFSVVVRSLRP